MPDIDLKYAIGLPPEKAIEYFKSKGYKFTWDWHEMWEEAHTKAFTVAKVTQMDILQDIRDMIQKSLEEGITFQQFKKELEPKLKSKGWWGKIWVMDKEGPREVQLGSPRRLETIYHTNMQTAYSAGRYREMIENVNDRPYWQYVAVLDSRTRPSHRLLNGKVFRYDDPFWRTHYPPNGWNCRCRVRALSKRDVAERRLEISSGEGNIEWQDVTISKRLGLTKPVAIYHDPKIGRIPTDPGWSYNPGEKFWEPDLRKYDSDIRAAFEKEMAKASVPNPVFTKIKKQEI